MVTNGTIHFLKISLVGFPKSHFKTNSVAILTTYFTVPDFTEIREEVIFCSKICIIFILELQKKLHLSLSTVKGNCNEIFDNKGDFVIWIFFDFSTKMTHQTICQIFFSQTNFQKNNQHRTYSWKSRHREGRKSGHPPWLYVVSALNHMMLMVNSSINFIIYCAFGSKFRRVVMEKLYPNFYNVRSRHTNSNGLDVLRTNENNLVSVFRILMKVMMLY